MKQFFLVLISAAFILGFSSSTKSKNKPASSFPCPREIKTKTQILISNTWKVDEVFSNVKGKNLHYIRNEINTTGHDYTAFELTFNADGTGTYTSEEGRVYTTRWSFTSPDEHNMVLELDGGASFNWSMVEISENSFQSITDLIWDGRDLLQSTRYIPVPKECSATNL